MNAISSRINSTDSAVARKIIDLVHHDAVIHVGQVPCRVEHELADFRHFGVHDFVPIVPGFVVILVHACEVEDYRDVVLGEVVMVAAVVKTIGVVWCVERVVLGDVGVSVGCKFTDFVKL